MHASFMEDDMRLALLCLLLVSMRAFAADVLIEHVPAGATPQVVMAVVKQAFINRRWAVTEADDASVSAVLDRRVVSARMRVYLVDRQLRFEGDGSQATNSLHASFTMKQSVPSKWVTNLRKDISIALSTIPDRAP